MRPAGLPLVPLKTFKHRVKAIARLRPLVVLDRVNRDLNAGLNRVQTVPDRVN